MLCTSFAWSEIYWFTLQLSFLLFFFFSLSLSLVLWRAWALRETFLVLMLCAPLGTLKYIATPTPTRMPWPRKDWEYNIMSQSPIFNPEPSNSLRLCGLWLDNLISLNTWKVPSVDRIFCQFILWRIFWFLYILEHNGHVILWHNRHLMKKISAANLWLLGARGFLREEPRSAISEAVKREKIHKRSSLRVERKHLGPG